MSKKGAPQTNIDLRYKGMKSIKNIPKEIMSQSATLKELDITGNEFVFAKQFKGFNALTMLNISKNKLKEIPQCIVDFPNLKILNVS